MIKEEEKKLKVHKDILAEYYSPYYEIEVYKNFKFPLIQYSTPVRNQANKEEIIDIEKIRFPCASCKSEDTVLLWARKLHMNAGGSSKYELKCKSCELYSLYIEKDFS